MMSVYQLKSESSDNDSGINFGGGAFIKKPWPKNPNGEDLTLLFTIQSDKFNDCLGYKKLPGNKNISVFSTYNKNRYFLGDITYFGDDVEFKYIKKGYTKVVISEKNEVITNGNELTLRRVKIERREIADDEYPAFSFLSDALPLGLMGGDSLQSEYDFICQIYSADISSDDSGVLGLSDAIGYLFLKKSIDDSCDAGFFFVQTA